MVKPFDLERIRKQLRQGTIHRKAVCFSSVPTCLELCLLLGTRCVSVCARWPCSGTGSWTIADLDIWECYFPPQNRAFLCCECIIGLRLQLDDVEKTYVTLWLFNIAMENVPFIDVFPIKTSIYKGFSMAMLNNQMVTFLCGSCVVQTRTLWLWLT